MKVDLNLYECSDVSSAIVEVISVINNMVNQIVEYYHLDPSESVIITDAIARAFKPTN